MPSNVFQLVHEINNESDKGYEVSFSNNNGTESKKVELEAKKVDNLLFWWTTFSKKKKNFGHKKFYFHFAQIIQLVGISKSEKNFGTKNGKRQKRSSEDSRKKSRIALC